MVAIYQTSVLDWPSLILNPQCFENHFFKKMKNSEGVKGKWGRKEVAEGFSLQNICI